MNILIFLTILLFFQNYSVAMGNNQCLQCHHAQAQEWAQSNHHKSFTSDKAKIKQSLPYSLNFSNKKGKFSTRTTRTNDTYLQQFLYKNNQKQSVKIIATMGSGTRGKSLIYKNTQGHYKLLPFGLIKKINETDLYWSFEDINGHDSTLDLTSTDQVPSKCFKCHATSSNITKVLHIKSNGVSCINCHGNSPSHIKNPTSQNIHKNFYPAQEFGRCTSCHTAEIKSTTLIHANQTYLLKQSQCFQKSKKLTCLNCHNPHSSKANDNSCFQCHKKNEKKHYFQNKDACIKCHMPNKKINMTLRPIKNKQFSPKVRTHFIKIKHE